MLPSSMTYDVNVSLPVTLGTVAEYKCDIGYQLTNGDVQRTCTEPLIWNGTESTCNKTTCPVTFHQVCYNCDIVDSDCPYIVTPATFDDCRSAAIRNNSIFVEHNLSDCKTFICQVPPITYNSGSVSIFASCSKGWY